MCRIPRVGGCRLCDWNNCARGWRTIVQLSRTVSIQASRIAFCGAVAQYNDLNNPPSAPRNLFELVERSIRLEGFLVRNYQSVQTELEKFLIPHILEGRVKNTHTITDGFDQMVEAFLAMLRGDSLGKMIVRIGAKG